MSYALNGKAGYRDGDADTTYVETPIAFHPTGGGEKGLTASENETPGTGTGAGGTVAIAQDVGVRRLTPRETERLQGLPDDWTAPESLGGPAEYRLSAKGKWRPVRGSGVTDNLRYAAIGNAVTVDVAEWIGRRIAAAGMRRAAR